MSSQNAFAWETGSVQKVGCDRASVFKQSQKINKMHSQKQQRKQEKNNEIGRDNYSNKVSHCLTQLLEEKKNSICLLTCLSTDPPRRNIFFAEQFVPHGLVRIASMQDKKSICTQPVREICIIIILIDRPKVWLKPPPFYRGGVKRQPSLYVHFSGSNV